MPGSYTVYIDLDWDGVRSEIVGRARHGLDEVAIFTMNRAKHYAPVRELFGRQRSGNYQRPFIRTEAEFKEFKKSLPHSRRIETMGGSVFGHRNSYTPVIRFRTPNGTATITGDFRVWRNGKLAKVPATAQIGHNDPYDLQVRASNLFSTSASGRRQSLLSAHGRYEVASGRAVSIEMRTGKARSSPVARVGGRLRNEIFIRRARTFGRSIWAYVVSPTPYAPYQEFGTRHNRAHPFLRPALYESRSQLRLVLNKGGRPKSLMARSLTGRI